MKNTEEIVFKRDNNPKNNPCKGGRKKRNNNRSKEWGVVFFFFGIILVLGAILIEEHCVLPPFFPLAIKLFEHLGVALIILGLVTFIVDLGSWQRYFQERLADTIIKREYLETLENAELISLQTDLLVALYGTDDIDRKDGFLEFFRKKIQDFIGSPFRDDTQNTMIIKYENDEKKRFIVEDAISYKCRKVGRCIQDSVRWINEESGRIHDFKIMIDIPKDIFELPEIQKKHTERTVTIKMDSDRLKKILPDNGYTFSLADYEEMDGLWVEVCVTYFVERDEIFYFRMAYPSHKMRVVIDYPEDLDISREFFGMAEEDLRIGPKPGILSINYDSWMLPNAGFAFHFRDKKPVPAQTNA